MLHRSFKPVKCKTSLKLASSRIKLLKNRKDVQVKQMKRELAQLLESGQDQTARIRVEHVIREEKLKLAYDLLEIYCELIAVRMQIIESQKNCPIDLKEAIASVLFASPRCSDVVELQDVRKHFTAKYGKEFVSAAIELRPESGVSRMMVEKLSAKTPDGHERIKILKEIAEEHNVKWDAKSLEQIELKPPADLLNGPNTFEKAKIIQTEPPQVQTATPSTFQSPQISTGAEHHQKTSFKPSISVDDAFVKNQNLEFENAVAAAKAAAESAEIACRAAKEAAELAREAKLSRQSSTESQKLSESRNEERRREDIKEFSNVKNPGNHSFQVKDEKGNYRAKHSDSLRSKKSADEKYQNADQYSQKNSYVDNHPVKEDDKRNHSFQVKHEKGNYRANHSDSLRSKTSADEKYQNADQYSQKNSFVDNHPVKEEKSNTLYSNQQSSIIEERIDKQASSDDDQRSYNHPRKNTYIGSDFPVEKEEFSDKTAVVFDDLGSDDDGQEYSSFGKKSFVNISGSKASSVDDQRNYNHPRKNSYIASDFHVEKEEFSDKPSVVFDDLGSDDDGQESSLFGKKPFVNISGSKASSDDDQRSYNHPRKNSYIASDFHVEKEEFSDKPSVVFDDLGSDDDGQESSLFGKKPLVNISGSKISSPPSQPEKLLPVSFDDSDGPSSDTEDEADKYKFNSQPSKNVYIQDPQPVLNKSDNSKKNSNPSNAKARVGLNSSFDDSDSLNEFGAWYDKEMNFDDEPVDPSQSRKTVKELTISDESGESSLDFGNLRGGLRHQKPRPPPYTNSAFSGKPNLTVSESDSDDSNVVPPPRQSPNRKRESFKVSESVEDQSSQVSAKIDRVETILSRRTKPTPKPTSRTETSPTKHVSSRPVAEERLDNSESSRISYNPKPKQEKPVSLRQRIEPDPSKSLAEERLGYSEAQPTSFRRKTKPGPTEKTDSKTIVEEKPINSEAKPRREKPTVTHQTEPDQSSSKTMAEGKPEKYETRSDRVSSRTSNDPKPEKEKPTSTQQRTEPGQSSSKTMFEIKPEKTEGRSDRVSSRTSSVLKPEKEKPTSTQQRTEPGQSSSKTMFEIKSEKSEARSDRVSSRTSNDPKPEKEKPASTQQRTEPGQSSSKTMFDIKSEKSEGRSDRVSSRTSNDPKPEKEKLASTQQKTEPGQSSSTTMSERKTEKSEAKTSTEEGLTSESSIKKASHVHPKLPDYDDIAARLQALRVNRG
ncbi:AF4/FMR2 family member 4-like isoform X2 [Impatiens glandulifera]|uniref:AF4/FMR2 family member 4-like isoform X2 n=1 Tax=Impatiens glandulifera TaxID=253017 RepID=UPI001FB092BF|nr:AF4/FMR2 family member 4-like isoform X2 [Impatiens glandulifera]